MKTLFFRFGAEVRQAVHHMLGAIHVAGEEALTTEQFRNLRACRDEAENLLRITADLLELAGSTARPHAATSTFDVGEAVEETCGLMRILASGKNLSLVEQLEPNTHVRIIGDKNLFQDSLRRLLDNAIRFTDSGTISLTARCGKNKEGQVTLAIEVADTGPGMPADAFADLEHDIAQPRLQGFSLHILRKRLEALGGVLSISANAPTGAVVGLEMPLSLADSEVTPASVPRPCSLPPLRILIAEDSDASFAVFRSYVKAFASQITRAVNGADAVEMAKQGNYEFIVMDVNMPRLDGYTATRRIREWETAEGRIRVPILLLSADESERQSRLGGAAGCSGYLTKPATKEQVVSAIGYYSRKPESLPH